SRACLRSVSHITASAPSNSSSSGIASMSWLTASGGVAIAATMIATCEGFALAQKLGLDPQVFYDISSKATGQSWSMTSYCPVPGVGPQSPSDNGYQGGFATALMLKDLKLAMEAAEGADATTPLGRRAKELYEAFDAAGSGGLDFSAIIKTME
ncbi:MAG: NAD-binding protein, partial [Tsuneonella sp.]